MPIVPLTGSELRKRKISIHKSNLIVSIIGLLFTSSMLSLILFVGTKSFGPIVMCSIGNGLILLAAIYYATKLIQAYRLKDNVKE